MNWSSRTQASKTRSRGALKTRTRRRVLSSRTAATTFLLGWLWLRRSAREERIESVERFLPEAAVELDPVGGGAQPLAAQRAAAPLGLGTALDQASLGQHLQMPRHRRQRHLERLGQLAHRGIA